MKPLQRNEAASLAIAITLLLIFGVIVYREMDKAVYGPNSTTGAKIRSGPFEIR